jgi:hypothetical protein
MRSGTVAGTKVPSFVEVMPGRTSQPSECLIELENAKGAKMRIHFKGVAAPETSKLCAEFLKNGQ